MLLRAAAGLPFAGTLHARSAAREADANAQLQTLENEFGGRLGVFALDTANGTALAHREDERFPLCSTFKVIAAAAILKRSQQDSGLLQRRLSYDKADLVEYSPVTEKHTGSGMTIADLCAAAIQYSDNTAANLMIRTLGNPEDVTVFARSIGDAAFRLDRWETELNTAIPGDPHDTTTPRAMALSLRKLVLGEALADSQRALLKHWMLSNTTGGTRIRAGVPAGWQVGDKTGTGSYGTANDVAVLWPPNRAPLVLSVYTTQSHKEAQARSDVMASTARIVARWAA